MSDKPLNQTTGSPHWHCTACHHEWDGLDEACCTWCGAPGEVIGRYHWPTWGEINRIVKGIVKMTR